MMPRAWLLGLMLAPGWGAAADLSPQDFAFGLPIVITKDASVYRFTLPLDVYRGIVREDLGDVRVFNADNEAVPYSLRRPTPPAAAHEEATSLPLLALRGNSRVVMDGGHLTIESPGGAASLPTQTGGSAAVNQYVLDGRGLDFAVAVLQLHWPETATDYSGRVKIEASDDLGTWQTLVAAAPTANLHANGQSLIENRVALNPVRAKFWRVFLDVAGAPDPAVQDADVFDLQARLPVSRLNISLPESNTVNTIELSSRRAPGDPWRTVTQSDFYRVKSVDGEQQNAPLDIALDRDRYWRARIVRGGGLPRLPLHLRVEWVPNEVTFLARGKPPFLLAYGNAAATSAEADISQIPADVEIAPAAVGTLQVLGGSSRLAAKPPSYHWMRATLWGALILAVALLGWVALRRSRPSAGPA
jgi:hypothetical protein